MPAGKPEAILELDLLLSRDKEDENVRACLNCDYEIVLKGDMARRILAGYGTQQMTNLNSYLVSIEDRIQENAADTESCLQILTIGICLLNAFMQVNYTGPALADKTALIFPQNLLELPRDLLYSDIIEQLVVDGERPYPLAEDLSYLLLANRIIGHKALEILSTQAWWKIRASFIHQKLLDDPVSEIHNIICDAESIDKIEHFIKDDSELIARWHLELAHYYSYYSYDQKALFRVREAQRANGLQMQVSGALGRRTKFQTFDVSQLVVLAKSSEIPCNEHTFPDVEKQAAPVALDLNDDTLLEAVSFTNTKEEAPYAKRYINPRAEVVSSEALLPDLAALYPGDQPQLSLVDQCILLAYAGVIKLSAASDDQIINEQVAAYIARVLQKPIDAKNPHSNWTVNSAALLAKTRVEGHRSRTVERSVLQLQALVDQLVDEIKSEKSLPIHNGDQATSLPENGHASFLRRVDQKDSATPRERLSHLFCLPLVSKWNMQTELAQKYTSIGLVRSALEIFQKLELWEQVALCYGAMDSEDKAESVLREQLELKKPGSDIPKLWCLLGDVTGNAEYWEKSWEVSDCHYARAQRSLGKYHFGRKDFGKALAAYSTSLKINPLNHGAWFMYGCAGLETAQFEVAAEAFTRCISIDQTDGESWNNLASALLRLGKDRKRDAWKALKTATNLKFESWRMWENYMLVSLDILEYGEVVRAMRRIIEIRTDAGESAIDVDVLRMLIQEIIGEDLSDADAELRGLPRMVNDLMVKTIQPLITHDPRLWRLLAKVYLWRKKYAEALDAHEKAYRCLTAKLVETEYPVFQEVVEAVEDLVDAYRSLGPMEGRMGGEVAKDWRFKSRSVVRTLKARGSNFEDTIAYQRLLGLLEDLKS